MNKEVTLTIEKLTYGGVGFARFEDEVVFVAGVLPEEVVRAKLVVKKQNYWEGELLQILKSSPYRVEPPCPYAERCGGCPWQSLDYPEQLRWKQLVVKESLQRLGGIENPNVLPTLPSPQIWGWRSRILVHSDGMGKIGFFEPQSHRVVDIEKCLVADEVVNQKLHKVRSGLKAKKGDTELRSDEGEGFAQVNPGQNTQLKKLLAEWIRPLPHDHVVELFCGNGNFSEIFLVRAKTFVGVDFSDVAIAQAVKTYVPPHTRTSAQFICADAAKWFSKYDPKTPLDLLFLDPPRDGCARVVQGVLHTKPENILYVSCNPTTLARDLKFLKEFAGYELVQVQPVDMFPHSYHIEILSWITKGSGYIL